MNIELQSVGLFMLIIVFAIMLRDKNLNLSMNRSFRVAMVSCIACLVMDISSVIAIHYASNGLFSDAATKLICKIYLVLLINVGYRGFLYVTTEFFREKKNVLIRKFYRALFFIGSLAILILPIDYHAEGRTVYSYGASAMSAYVFAFIAFISTLIFIYWDREGTSRRRRRIVLIWQICWTVAALIQFLNPEILLVSFAAAAGILLVYAELENPNELIDRTTGQFNYTALSRYIEDMYVRNASLAAMRVSVNYSAGDLELELAQSAIRRVANFFDAKDSYVFREADDDLLVVYKDEESLMRDYEKALRELGDVTELPISFSYTLIPDNKIFETADEFLQFQHYDINTISTDSSRFIGAEQAEEMRGRLRIRDSIEWALANKGVEVYYQPIYSLKEKRFTAAEALLRIKDSDGKLIMPRSFIPIAEESGLIIPLSKELFRQVCELLAEGEVQKLGIDTISINLSMAQFSEAQPAAFVIDMMTKYKIDPARIVFEITETADNELRQYALKNMERLVEVGSRFALDDFGTGRSNFDYFVAMPINVIKFDYNFTHWYFESERNKKIVLATVNLIKSMGFPTVMEGVETKTELDAMVEIGASYIQGFYFSKPIPKDEFIQFLKTKN